MHYVLLHQPSEMSCVIVTCNIATTAGNQSMLFKVDQTGRQRIFLLTGK